jgi:hypothetical protein
MTKARLFTAVTIGLIGVFVSSANAQNAAPWASNASSHTNAIVPGFAIVDPTTKQPVSSYTNPAGTLTQTETSVAATTSTQISALTSRRALSITNDGTSNCRVSYGIAATATNGEPLNGASTAGTQGGAHTWDANFIPQAVVYAYCPTAGSFSVLEGQ